ncbi:hypothetical protein [Chitinophaga nivalis]|uniref:Outer membrane protein beta-barrel domain-containing protein n=1 Tax=Chitinophaga nivalis TaxID=2991709 RepID=A0ABT3IE75_9BACT|nr:hypothetical protein [Chitinophaga nivalis]MCW3468046.1 hypothetical protein [Chitinophaga nivalis]MCW3482263.1 hypothetical protein [Chitinophaga nivalis]
MKKICYQFILLLIAVGIVSCNRHIYVPNTVNVPLLKEKHEFKASISPTNLQTAFALTDNLAIMANGQYVYRFDFSDRSDEQGLFVDNQTRGGVVEGAIGFFKPFGPKKQMVFDAFAGYGMGSFKTFTIDKNDNPDANANDYLLKNRFSKVFIQPSIGFVHPVVEAAFSSRFSMLNFYNNTIGPKAFENDATGKSNFQHINSQSNFFYEPAFTFRVGYKYVKFQLQLQASIPITNSDYREYKLNEFFQPLAFGMGASIDIARWYHQIGKK